MAFSLVKLYTKRHHDRIANNAPGLAMRAWYTANPNGEFEAPPPPPPTKHSRRTKLEPQVEVEKNVALDEYINAVDESTPGESAPDDGDIKVYRVQQANSELHSAYINSHLNHLAIPPLNGLRIGAPEVLAQYSSSAGVIVATTKSDVTIPAMSVLMISRPGAQVLSTKYTNLEFDSSAAPSSSSSGTVAYYQKDVRRRERDMSSERSEMRYDD